MSLEKCCKSSILVSASLGHKWRIPMYQTRFFMVSSPNLVSMYITTMCCGKNRSQGKSQVNQFWQFVFLSAMTFPYNNDGLKESPYYFHRKVISVPKRRDHSDLFFPATHQVFSTTTAKFVYNCIYLPRGLYSILVIPFPLICYWAKPSLRVEFYPNFPGYTNSSSLYGNLMNIVWD